MAGLATLLGVVTVWLASSGVPTRFAVALAVGVAAAGVWGLAWLRIVLRSRQERLRPPARAWATPQQAEQLAWRWMRYLGHSDAELTGRGVDGGIDVVAAGAVAQVKATVRPTGRPVVQQAYGAAAGRACAVFARGGFTDLARRWADEQGVALFRFDQEGNVSPVNGLASRWIDGADRRARAAPDAQRR